MPKIKFLGLLAVISLFLSLAPGAVHAEQVLMSSSADVTCQEVSSSTSDQSGAHIHIANHGSDGVLEKSFPGNMRCSAVCPVMRDIASNHCTSFGQCWCDEQGSKTIGYISCQ